MYRIVQAFFKDKSLAKRELSTTKRKWPEAELVEDSDGFITIVLGKASTQKKAEEILHKALRQGVGSGIEEIQ